ncbi:MAG: tripartite tricarboxylate transporter substrate binding protein BugD [Alphaproteobacteria bacterium]|nr:tripartite tricarboxylate transporter substrate binding protein BugD [Alphaproteobacteria bacterium]
MRRTLSVLVIAAAFVTGAQAQTYPSRPVTIIVPFPAGGSTGAMARILLEPLQAALGQTVIVENVGGAGGSIGAGRVARAAPDGYTAVFSHLQTHVLNGAVLNLTYDVVADFEPVALIADTPQTIVARKAFPADNLKDTVAWLRANPGKGTVGAVGVGGPSDITVFQFQKLTGTRLQLVPYRGGAPLLQDLVSGQIDFNFGQASTYLGAVRSGQLKALAVQRKQRWPIAPEIPTVDEGGVPGLYGSYWHGMWLPKGTPKDIVVRLNAAVVAALGDPAVQKRFSDFGQETWPRAQQTPEALAAHQKAEIERWWPIVKAAGIKPQ